MTSLESFRQSFAFSGDEGEPSPVGEAKGRLTLETTFDEFPPPAQRLQLAHPAEVAVAVRTPSNALLASGSGKERSASTPLLAAGTHHAYSQPPITVNTGTSMTPLSELHTPLVASRSASESTAATSSNPTTPLHSNYSMNKKIVMTALLELGSNAVSHSFFAPPSTHRGVSIVGRQWEVEDAPMLKRLTKRLLKLENMITLPANETLWNKDQEANMVRERMHWLGCLGRSE